MRELYNKVSTTLKREGVSATSKKISRRILYKLKRSWNNDRRNYERWSEIKDKFKGERAFLLGNGPSLNKTPLYMLKNDYTMCFNHFNILSERLNWFLDFYMSTDNLVINDVIKDLNSISEKSKLVFLPDIHFRGEN